MILIDMSMDVDDGVLIGIQKSKNKYVYLHWGHPHAFKWAEYHTQIAGNYKGIEGIGPTMLVEWEE